MQIQTFNNLKYVDCMVLEALEWGVGCPFADKRHDLAARSVPLYVGRKGRERAAGCVIGGVLPPVCSSLPP